MGIVYVLSPYTTRPFSNTPQQRNRLKGDTDNEPTQEVRVERQHPLDILHLFSSTRDLQRLQVRKEALDLAPANNREHVRCVLHHVCDCDSRDALRADFPSDLLERCAQGLLALVAHPIRGEDGAALLPTLDSSASVRTFPASSTFQGASAMAQRRAIGMISRSKLRSITFHALW